MYGIVPKGISGFPTSIYSLIVAHTINVHWELYLIKLLPQSENHFGFGNNGQ